MKRMLAVVLFLSIAGPYSFAATTQDALREIESLVKMNKPEQAFMAAVLAVKTDPSAAPQIRDVASQALEMTMTKAKELYKTGKFNDSLILLRPLWNSMYDLSAAALFDSQASYEAKMKEIYAFLVEGIMEQAQFFESRRNFVQAAYFAEMCIKLRPENPDPRAVQLLESLKKQSQAVPAGPVTGTEFTLKAPADDGFSGKAQVNKPELRIGMRDGRACLSFPGVTIPQGARIKSAIIRGFLVTLASGNTLFHTMIGTEQVDNGLPVTPSTPLVSNRPISQRLVKWQMLEFKQGWMDSPDIKVQIQEIVNRPGWKPGNRLNVLCDLGRGTATFISFEEDPQRSFRLIVDWN